MKGKTKYILLFLAVAFTYSTTIQACGKERWPVKVGTDKDAVFVSKHAIDTTITKLTALPAPANPSIRPNTRYQPIETSVFRISGRLIEIKREVDEDYHLVIQDDHHRTMILVVPAPRCAKGSRFLAQIKQVRQDLEQRYPLQGNKMLKLNSEVTVTGVAFFDRIHGQEGVAPNGIELHPVLSIVYKPDSGAHL